MKTNRLPIGLLVPCLIIVLFALPLIEVTAQNSHERNGILAGLDAGITYTADLFGNVHGGAETGFAYMDNLDIEVSFDTDRGFGWGSTQFYVYGLGNQGGSISRLAGDLQVASNIEAETSWRIYEAWIQKFIYKLRTSILVGLYDLNSEFDVINTATLFINSSHGIGPEFGLSGVLGPSIFPYTSFGARVKTNIFKGFVFKGTVLDGIPSNPEDSDGTKIYFRERDGLLVAAELAYFSSTESNLLSRPRTARIRHYLTAGVGQATKFKIAAGGWHYTREREGWLGESHHDRGVYGLAEYRFFSEPKDELQGFSGFFRYGLANEDINRLDSYLGAGLVYRGLIPNRPKDRLGLAVAWASASDEFREFKLSTGMQTEQREVNLEATYQLSVKNISFLQFDLQYIINPGMVNDREHAFVIGSRIQVTL